MEENRFLRVYQEHKLEKEQLSQKYNNRFECLRETHRQPVREINNRFECLRGDYKSEQDVRINNQESNRFNCLAGNTYNSTPIRREERISFLPQGEAKESVNTRMKREQEERKRLGISRQLKPVFSVDSDYHFPELSTSLQQKPEIKLLESKLQKAMIVNSIVVKDTRKITTVMIFRDGKVVAKDVYDDGTEVVDKNTIILKKPTYTSWASVLKPNTDEVHYEIEHKKRSDL